MQIFSKLLYFIKDFSPYIALFSLVLLITPIVTFKIYKSKLAEIKKKLLFAIWIILFTLVLIIFFAEAYFRYIYDQSDGLGFLKVNRKWHERHVMLNSDFFRDENFTNEKEPQTLRIAALGDSLTFGGGIENVSDRFSNLLQTKLTKNGKKAQVYNLGLSGQDTESEIKVYNKFAYLGFDVVIWQYYFNDVQPLEKSTGTSIINENSKTGRLVGKLSNASYFFDFMYWRLSSKYQSTFRQLQNADLNQYQNPQTFENHKNQIQSFTKLLKDQNKRVIVVLFPFIQSIGPNYPAQMEHDMIKDIFIKNEVEVVDLLESLQNYSANSLLAGKFDTHPNEFVNSLVSDLLFERLKN